MISYFAMINAWSLAWDALNGTMDEEYPIIDTSVGAGNTASQDPDNDKGYYYQDDGLDYEVDLFDDSSADYLADIDDQRAHHFSTYDDGFTLQVTEEKPMKLVCGKLSFRFSSNISVASYLPESFEI